MNDYQVINIQKIKNVIDNYSFVVLDLILKIYLLYFVFITNEILEKEIFDQVSYLRATIGMFTGIAATALGFYIFNYYKEALADKNIVREMLFLNVVVLFSCLSIFIVIMFFFPSLIHFDKLDIGNELYFLLICLLSMISQILIYYLKVMVDFSNYAFKYFMLMLLIFILTIFLIKYDSNNGPFITLIIYYLINVLFFIYCFFKEDRIVFFKELRLHDILRSDRVRQFYIPNLLESIMSVPRVWASISVLIFLIGFSGVGEILLIQMILGLFVFFCNSLVLNFYIEIEVGTLDERNRSLKKISKKIGPISIIFIIFAIVIWDTLKNILEITVLNDAFILVLCLGALIQIYILPIGLIFKKYSLSKLTLFHNVFYTSMFLLLEVILLEYIGLLGYALALFFAWLLLLVLIIYQSNKYSVVSIFNYLFFMLLALLMLILLFWLIVYEITY
jgi:hypothetical protein